MSAACRFLKISALGVEEQRVNLRIDPVGDPGSWSHLGHGYRIEARIVTDEARGVMRVPAGALFHEAAHWAVSWSETAGRICAGLRSD